ncbi:MAG: hypothetical protein K2L14_01500 [Duncaniella sp.]|nr:hypothetical protein [Duncaniella sp.]
MKKLFRKTLMACVAMSCIAFCSCGNDNHSDEPDIVNPDDSKPVHDNSLTYTFVKGNFWSAIGYEGVTLAEIHSDVTDYQLQCEAPQGYRISLLKSDKKDGGGFTVYRIVCDMDENPAETTDNKNTRYNVTYTISGNGYRDGKPSVITYENSVDWQRFESPVSKPDALYRKWYLSEYSVEENLDWVEFSGRTKYSETKVEPRRYSPSISPLKIFGQKVPGPADTGGNILHYIYSLSTNATQDFPGWKTGDNELANMLYISCFLYPMENQYFGASIVFLNDQKLRAMKPEYSSDGKLLRVHRYEFMPE